MISSRQNSKNALSDQPIVQNPIVLLGCAETLPQMQNRAEIPFWVHIMLTSINSASGKLH